MTSLFNKRGGLLELELIRRARPAGGVLQHRIRACGTAAAFLELQDCDLSLKSSPWMVMISKNHHRISAPTINHHRRNHHRIWPPPSVHRDFWATFLDTTLQKIITVFQHLAKIITVEIITVFGADFRLRLRLFLLELRISVVFNLLL